MVEAELPSECFIASEMSVSEVRDRVCGPPARGRPFSSSSSTIAGVSGKEASTSSGENDTSGSEKPSARKKQHKCPPPAADSNSITTSGGAEKVAEAIRDLANAKMQDEVAKQKLRYMENEDSRRGHELLLFEWEKVQNGICMLRDQLDRPNISDRTRTELFNDIEGLLHRKDKLAEKLRFVKRILRYLQKTKAQGLILKPQVDHRVDCYVDADFGGLFSVEDPQQAISVKSRTGYVILYRGAPLLWVSKMQTQVALSTMEAEYIALSQSMRDLIPIREILHEILTSVFDVLPSITYHSHSRIFEDVLIGTTSHVLPQSTVYEDNDACLKFARMPKLTPRTKHIGVPYHWFRSQVENLSIHIERVATNDQLADQFTKGLPTEPFRAARISALWDGDNYSRKGVLQYLL
jgi:hypothetical protein